MRILPKYTTTAYLTAFLLAVLVLTFVLSIGILVKAMELVVRGLEPSLVARFLLVSIPETFTFTIPLSALVSALLVFGRLSADSEICAMRACGVNIWSVMMPIVFFGVMLSAFSIYVNNEIVPPNYHARRTLTAEGRSTSIMHLLVPGQFVKDFPGFTFWFESREDTEYGTLLKNLIIIDKMANGKDRETRAEQALVNVDDTDLILEVFDATIDPPDEDLTGIGTSARIERRVPDVMKTRRYKPTMKTFSYRQLVDTINLHKADAARISDLLARSAAHGIVSEAQTQRNEMWQKELEQAEKSLSQMRTEYHRRLALGLAPLAFILLGLPLGIQTSRKENNIGIATSLIVMVAYYAAMIIAKSVDDQPALFPHLLIWLPPALCFGISCALVRRHQ